MTYVKDDIKDHASPQTPVTEPGTKPFRRVITGVTEAGESTIMVDTAAPIFSPEGLPGLKLADMWRSSMVPPENMLRLDGMSLPTPYQMEPGTGGSVFRLAEIPPDHTYLPSLNENTRNDIWISLQSNQYRTEHSKHPLMHKTQTLDYGIVLSGEIYLVLETEETRLTQGNCIVQRATNHAWSNRSDKPCLMAFIMLSTESNR